MGDFHERSFRASQKNPGGTKQSLTSYSGQPRALRSLKFVKRFCINTGMLLSKALVSRSKRWLGVTCEFSVKKKTQQTQKNQTPMVPLDESDMKESFVRGSGPGGQKINKSMNNVLLVHIPTGISVQCQETRDLSSNRKIARKLLRDKVDLALNGETSKLGKKFERIRKKKRNSARRATKKYGQAEDNSEASPGTEDSDSSESESESESDDEIDDKSEEKLK